ncbi:MAG: valine--tRNA ligase [Myxococcaceae bacterium]|nr:valine--tRNA ligase [Myxococcaceae bacterium]
MSEDELSKAYDPSQVEKRWYPHWLERGYFKAQASSSKPPYCIVLPPPNVTGSLHLGHALTATIQDILIRWKRMSGFNCLWVPGTDHAGIATQMVVERELQKEKITRHDLGREKFLERVWAWKMKYGERIGEQHKVLGASLDWSRERFTMDEGLSHAVKEVFVRLYEQGLMYRSHRLINWDPVLKTALSDLEVDHEEIDGSLWHISYPVKGSDRRLTVATTRPETMLGDTAVAVHPDDLRYQDLIGKTVVLPLVNREIPIIADAQLVNMEFGTGVVKVTPAHDHNDYATGLRHQLPMISVLDDAARTNENAGAYAGLDRFEARKRVVADLEQQGFLVKIEPHKLSLAVSQRSHVPVEPMLSPQWYVKTQPLAQKAIEAVEAGRTRFVPEPWTNTFYSWMHNIQDWCVSRQLWWGHQIPAWYPVDTSPKRSDGTIDFAKATPTVARSKPGKTAENPSGEWVQDPDVLDTWFSSGLWPFSTLGWPEQTEDLKTFYPNSVMETGHDIIFFWVARMMMMGLHLLGDVPFRTVYLHAMVRDEKGEKMSKTKGNVIDPLDIVNGQVAANLPAAVRNKFPQGMPAMGADAMRFTLAAFTQQGRDIKLSLERISGYKAFCNKIWNASRFALMNLGDYRADETFIKDRQLSLADRWILARLNKAISGTQSALTQFQFSDAASTLYQFLWGEFCDWYIELSKGSLYGADEEAKQSTRAVLVYCLDHILRLLHPFMPFITEEIWQKLPIARSVETICLAPYPEVNRRLDDPSAEAEMKPLIEAIDGLRAIRGESNLSPGLKLAAHIQTHNAQNRATLEKWRGYLMPLAGLSSVQITAPGVKPLQAAAEVRGDLEIYVPLAGIVDLAEERTRIQKEITKAENELVGLKKRLDNESFVKRAPPEVVEKDRARIDELTGRVTKLHDNLGRIQPVQVKIAPPAEGAIDLGEELKEELAQVTVAAPDAQVKEALDKLREGTKEGLSSKDHYDLGVAYMGMGLVDDAVREFTVAKKGDEVPAAKKSAPGAAPKAAVAVKKGKAPAKPAAKKAAPKAKASPKKAVAKKLTAKGKRK